MINFLLNNKLAYLIVLLLVFQACVTDKSGNVSVPEWSDIQKKSKSRTLTIAVESGISQYSGNITNQLKLYFKNKYNISFNVEIVRSEHLSSTQCDLIYARRSKVNALYKNNLLLGPFKDKLPNKQYLLWDTYCKQKSTDILDEYLCTWGNVDVTFHRKDSNQIIIPKSILELEQIVNANPNKYSIGKGRVGLKLFANLIVEVSKQEKLDLIRYNRDTFDKLKILLDERLQSLKQKFWRNGKENFNELGIPSAMMIGGMEKVGKSSEEFTSNSDILCLAIPQKSKNKETALFVINDLCLPEMRMKRVNSILKEQLKCDISLPGYIDSNYIIRYYDDFKYCSK